MGRDLVFSEWGFIFKRRGAPLEALALMGGGIFKKYHKMELAAPPSPQLQETKIYLYN